MPSVWRALLEFLRWWKVVLEHERCCKHWHQGLVLLENGGLCPTILDGQHEKLSMQVGSTHKEALA